MRVCFVSYHAFPFFDRRCRSPVGGAETHAWLLAHGLSGLSQFDVQFVVQAPRLFRRRSVDGVAVWNIGDVFDPLRQAVSQRADVADGRPWVRIRQWHPSLLWEIPVLAAASLFREGHVDPLQPHSLYERMAPDVICCFGVSGHAATAISSARQLGCKTVLFLESNNDLDEQFIENSSYVTPYGERGDVCDYVLAAADLIVAQSPLQQELLRQRRGRESARMTNAIDLNWWDRLCSTESDSLRQHGVQAPYVLWIGRADQFHKRPALCLEIARQCLSIPFVMILNPGDPIVEQDIRAHAPPNVTIIPRVPFCEMPAVISGACAYVSTGSKEYEGNPNVFLQAAASGVPILSLEVTSELLEKSRCGLVANGDRNGLAESLQRLWHDGPACESLGRQGREYVERHCDLTHVAAEVANLLGDLAAAPRAENGLHQQS